MTDAGADASVSVVMSALRLRRPESMRIVLAEDEPLDKSLMPGHHAAA